MILTFVFGHSFFLSFRFGSLSVSFIFCSSHILFLDRALYRFP